MSRDRHDGLGLGLAIAAQTAALLGCRLRLTSRPGRGTVVLLRMPHAGSVGTEMAATAKPLADGITGRCVLVVDDDAEQRRQLCGLLERWGARVGVATGIASAREKLAGAAFDAMVVDQHLADGNGLSLIDELPGSPSRPAALLVTGDVASIEAIRTRYPGLMVLTKPVVPLRLRSVLHYLLGPASVGGQPNETVVGTAGPVGRAAG
jgi:CheY-like chemotaxis protein